jgi:hypothetical protein
LAKQRRTNPQQAATATSAPRYAADRGSSQGLALATLGGVMLLLMISFSNWREIDGIDERLDARLGQIDARITEMATKVNSAPTRAAAAPTRGLDPNKVYPIKIAGAPSKGPAKAVVTIAEFSDFQ